MDTDLRPSGEEVLKLNAELEQRVAERTAELAFINERLRAEIVERMRVETELRYHAYLLENVQDAIIATDEKFAVTSWNSAAENIYGWAAEEVMGKIVHDLLRSEFTDAERAEALRSLHETGRFHTEVLQHKRDGKPIWVEGRVMALRDSTEEVTGFVTVNRDITARRQVEDALRRSEEKFKTIFEFAPVGISVLDQERRIVDANPALAQIMRIDEKGLVAGDYRDRKYIRPDGTLRPASEKASERAINENQPIHGVETGIFLEDGQLIWVQVNAVPLNLPNASVVVITQNITERKQAEEAIRKSEQVLREAESLGHTGSWEQNLITGEIFNTEENLHLFFGDDHSKGTPLDDYAQAVHPDDREYVMQRRVQLLAEGGPGDIEFRVVWPDGSVHILFGRSTVVYDELGQAIRVYGTNVDITERKKAEEDIRRYAAQMEALAEISHTFAEAGLDVQAVFETIVRYTAELIGDTCVIRLLSSDEQWLQSVAFHNRNPEVKALMSLLHPTNPTSANHSWLTPVLQTGQPLLIPIITQEQLRRSVQPEYLPFFEQVGLHSMLVVPLRVKGRVIGTLGLSRDQPGHPYTPDDQVLLQDLADRASLTIQNAQLFEQVQGTRQRLEALSRRLLEVQESERRALTMELHDRVGQNLTGLGITLQNMKALLSGEAAQRLAANFDDVQALVEDTTRQIRDIMAELHLPELEDYGLAAALEIYAERATLRGNLELIADLPDLAPPPLPSDVRIALFRSAQEAISNVLKHADATQLEISLQGEDGRVRLRVEDDGQGFEPEAAFQKEAPSWGLKIMRERIESIGGKVHILSEPGAGTRVTFEIERPL